ncbi:MAG: hypothetical protein HY807_10035 [Nitrospirae bacterium]|nr:hypothetical protein [Nitrospirota bacterium]
MSLTSSGGTIDMGGNITADSHVTGNAANNIAISAPVTITADADLTGTAVNAGNVTLNADTDSSSAGDLTMYTLAGVGSGSTVIGEQITLTGYNISSDIVTARDRNLSDNTDVINITAQDSVILNDTVYVVSGIGDIDIDATLGSISQTTGAYIRTVSGELFIDSATGAGDGNSLETEVAEITGRNTLSGDIDINELNALRIDGLTQENDGDIFVDAGDNILVSSVGLGGVGITTRGNGEVDINMTGAFDAGADTIIIDNTISTFGPSPDGSVTILNSEDAPDSSIDINGAITTVGGLVNIDTTAGRIDVDAPVTTGNLGTIDIMANGGAAAGNTVGILEISDAITSVFGDITLQADDNVNFDNVLSDVNSILGDVLVRADFDNDNNGSGGVIYMLNGSLINTDLGTITLNADERVTVSQLITNNDTDTAVVVTSKNRDIVDGGDSAGGTNPRTEDIIAPNGRIVLDAVTGIGSTLVPPAATAALEIDGDSVDAENLTNVIIAAGNIDLLESGDIDVVQLRNGVANDETATTGMITLRTIDGTITLLDDNGMGDSEGVSAIDGNIVLDANETNLTDDRLSRLIINAPINNTDTGNITLTADDNVEFGLEGDVTIADVYGPDTIQTLAGDVIVEADDDAVADDGNGGAIIMSDNNETDYPAGADATVIDAGEGLIRMSADEDIIVGQLTTTHNVATEIEVVLESINGSILDAGDSANGATGVSDIVVDEQYGSVALIAEHGIGTDANSIETTVREAAATTVDGDIHIRDVDVNVIDGLYVVDMSAYASAITPLKGSGQPDGVTITDGMVDDNITIIAASPLTIDAPVTNDGGSSGEPYEVGAGDITLVAEGRTVADDLILNDDVTATCTNAANCDLNGYGDITLYAGDDIYQNAGVTVMAAGPGNISYHAGVDYNKGVLRPGFDNLFPSLDSDIVMATSADTISGTGTITMTATDNVVLGSDLLGGVRTGGTVSITADDNTDYDLVPGNTNGLADGVGAINANTHPFAGDLEIAAPTIILNAASGIGAGRLPAFPDVLHINGTTVTGNVTSVDADINIDNAATTDTVVSLTTSGDAGTGLGDDASNIIYNQTGGFELDIEAVTDDGDITIDNDGDIIARYVNAFDNDGLVNDPYHVDDQEGDVYLTATNGGDITIMDVIATDTAYLFALTGDIDGTTDFSQVSHTVTDWNDGEGVIDAYKTVIRTGTIGLEFTPVLNVEFLDLVLTSPRDPSELRSGWMLRGSRFDDQRNIRIDYPLPQIPGYPTYHNDLIAPGVVRIGNWYFENPTLNDQTNRDLNEAYYLYINNVVSSFADEWSLTDEAWKYRTFHEESISVMDISLVTSLGEMGLLEKEKANK